MTTQTINGATGYITANQLQQPNAALPPAPADPRTLLGNSARQFPVPATCPLNLDAAFAQIGGIPTAIPYPYAESPGPYAPGFYAADYQAYLDFTGIVTGVVDYMESNNGQTPPPQKCQDLATYSGDAFQFGGKIYRPGAWSPF